jgi:hypothetical protein
VFDGVQSEHLPGCRIIELPREFVGEPIPYLGLARISYRTRVVGLIERRETSMQAETGSVAAVTPRTRSVPLSTTMYVCMDLVFHYGSDLTPSDFDPKRWG